MKSVRFLVAAFSVVMTFVFAQGVWSSETAEGVKKDYAAFKKEANERLEQLDKKIEKLKSESKGTMAKEAETARDKLRREVEEAQKTTASNWSRFKKSFAEKVDTLNTKVQKALNE